MWRTRLLSTSRPTPVTLKQLNAISGLRVHNSSDMQQCYHFALKNSTNFLSEQIPLRLAQRSLVLDNHLTAAYLPSAISPQIQGLQNTYENLSSKFVKFREKTSTNNLPSSIDSIQKFSTELLPESVSELESKITLLQYDFHDLYLADTPFFLKQHQKVDHILDDTLFNLIGLRALHSQHKSLHDNYESSNLSSILSKPQFPSIVSHCDLMQLASYTANDAAALCVEKRGSAPDFKVTGDKNIRVLCIESHLHFILMEVIKNAMVALVEKYDISVWDSPPVEIRITKDKETRRIIIEVEDKGDGIPEEQLEKIWRFFYTTLPYTEPSYCYGGNFGGVLSGLGFGLPMTRNYVKYLGGRIHMKSEVGKGTTVCIDLNPDGNVTDLL